MSNIIVSGENIHSFVRRWIEVLFTNAQLRVSLGAKDWQLIEEINLRGQTAEEQIAKSNVISFNVNRKTHPAVAKSNRDIYRLINSLVMEHCIDTEISLPGFYAFLRQITGVQNSYPEAFENDPRLRQATEDLVIGYWELVKPSLQDVTHGQSNDMQADMEAIQGINHLTQDDPRSERENQLKAQPPFKKRIQNDVQQAFSFKPTSTPTLSR